MLSFRTAMKVLYALSLMPLLVLFAATGHDRGGAYWFVATLMILVGGMCLASVVPNPRNRRVVGISYVVVLELAMTLL